MRTPRHTLALWALALFACGEPPVSQGPSLVINEVCPSNDGVWVDELGETDDWVELYNATAQPIDLAQYEIGDGTNVAPLPEYRLAPGEILILFADGETEQSWRHLPFSLDADGERVELWRGGSLIDRVVWGETAPNLSYARLPGSTDPQRCEYPTPARPNGERCGPPPPPELPPEVTFEPFTWPEPFPAPPGPIVITELALRPARFVELLNTSSAPVDLTGYALEVAPHGPGLAWPARGQGVALAIGTSSLAPGARLVVPVSETDVAALAGDPAFEGVVTLFSATAPIDRADFMWWPEGAALARMPDAAGLRRFCNAITEGAANDPCDPLASRPIGDRLRHLYTPGDLAALAAGDTSTEAESVKIVVDMQAGGAPTDPLGDVVHLLANDWELHYGFIRETIYGQPHLDLCEPDQAREYRIGWTEFSQREYFQVEGRRFLLATLNRWSGRSLSTLEFATGDMITGELMRRAFFATTSHTLAPSEWSVRPQAADQLARAQSVEGTLPLVDPNAPFRDRRFIVHSEGVAYGTLVFVPASELGQATLGLETIAVTDAVPNDVAFVGGLITEAFQTPLAHVSVLSKNRGTPDVSLRDARNAPELAGLFGRLVRLEATRAGIEVREASAAEAEAYWEMHRPTGELFVPRLDTSVTGLVDLAQAGLSDLPSIGAKAAQLAELARVVATGACTGPVPTPERPFAVPISYSWAHFIASGGRARLLELEADPAFRADPAVRAAGLAELRAMIEAHPIDGALVQDIAQQMRERWSGARARMRSSSNTEDLPEFNGAGLYTSVAVEGADEAQIREGLYAVWTSLWGLRAYEERRFARIDQTAVGIAVLVHPAFESERANGVAVSRDLTDPTRSDHYYANFQVGEASVTNPAPGVGTEAFLYRWGRAPRIVYQSRSTLTTEPVLSTPEIDETMCFLSAIHRYFQERLDPDNENPYFAIEIEIKRVGPARRLLIKQARPYSFGSLASTGDCRERL